MAKMSQLLQMPISTDNKIYGVVAEFEDPADLLHAAEKVRAEGYQQYDCHSPFPIHGMDDAMGQKRSPVGYLVGVAALLSFIGIVATLYWITDIDYKFVISGKPYFSYQAYVPVIFAICILTSAVIATLGMIVLNRLPQWFHPLFESENFTRFSNDGFFVSIASSDPKFDSTGTCDFLKGIGGTKIELIEMPAQEKEGEE